MNFVLVCSVLSLTVCKASEHLPEKFSFLNYDTGEYIYLDLTNISKPEVGLAIREEIKPDRNRHEILFQLRPYNRFFFIVHEGKNLTHRLTASSLKKDHAFPGKSLFVDFLEVQSSHGLNLEPDGQWIINEEDDKVKIKNVLSQQFVCAGYLNGRSRVVLKSEGEVLTNELGEKCLWYVDKEDEHK